MCALGVSRLVSKAAIGWLIACSALLLAGQAGAQSFSDVPTDHWAYKYIERLAASGITSGCGGGKYCPLAQVSRAEMAVLLERGMRGSDFRPPAAKGNVFMDVAATDFAASYIEQLSLDGVTGGCGGGKYCPTSTVTRAQMAVFLLRAKHGQGYSPPPATGRFQDVPLNYWAVHWIEQLAREGITGGCGRENFCPGAAVTRDQMAVFLVRTFAFGLGWVTTRLSSSGDSGAVAAVVQPDGKIVVAGGAADGPAFDDFAVARYNSDGSLDNSFSGDGRVLTNIFGRTASADWVRGVALQTDGKVVVVGYTNQSGSDSYGLAVVRYNSDGSLDSTFSGDGVVTKYVTSGTRNLFGNAVAIQPDGKILVAGDINCVDKYTAGYCTLLARFNSDGSFDTAFDAAFFARASDNSTQGAAGLALQGDGGILVAGTRDSGGGDGFAVARYTADGSRDTSFGTDGVATAFISTEVGSRDSGTSIALQPDGKIIVAGTTYTLSANNHFGVARFLSDGRIDTGFGASGVLTTNISGGAESDHASSVAVQPDGKILVAGDMLFVRSDPFPYPGLFSEANVDFAVVRYNSNGSLDKTFAGDGIATTDFRLLADLARNVIVQPNGAIVLAGSSFTHDPSDAVSGGYGSFAIARYNADGTADKTLTGGTN
jgi:uncharacterized delta-60 repeat protein